MSEPRSLRKLVWGDVGGIYTPSGGRDRDDASDSRVAESPKISQQVRSGMPANSNSRERPLRVDSSHSPNDGERLLSF